MKITLLEWCKQNIEQGNRILKEWTGIDIEYNNVDIAKISYGSNSKAYWVCPMCKYGENGEWYRSPNNRTASGGHGCPRCRYNWAKLSQI